MLTRGHPRTCPQSGGFYMQAHQLPLRNHASIKPGVLCLDLKPLDESVAIRNGPEANPEPDQASHLEVHSALCSSK